MAEIKYNVAEIEANAKELAADIATFSGYNSKYLASIGKELARYSSDFTDKMNDVLHNMTDTKAPTLMKKLEDYQAKLMVAAKEMKTLDEEISGGMKE